MRVILLAPLLLGGCAVVPSAIERPRTSERAIVESAAVPSVSAPMTRERPFEPRAGVVILGPEGRLIVMQLWEGSASPESACPSGLPARSASTWRDVATLHVMPAPGESAPSKANGYRFEEDTFAVFSGRLFEQNLKVTQVKLPSTLRPGTTITVPVGVSDVAGASVYEGRVRLFVCDLSK